MRKFTFYLIIYLFIVGCQQSNEPQQVKDSDSELELFIRDYYAVMSQRDWKAYKAFFAEKAILTTIWQGPNDPEPKVLTNSITDFLAQTENGPDSQPIFSERPIDIHITSEKNLASAWVYYEAEFGTESNLIRWKGYDVFSLLQFQGKWHIISVTYISDN